MGYEVSLSSADARVRSAYARRGEARSTSGAPMYLVVQPIAPPRLWRMVSDDVSGAFERAVNGQPPNPATVRTGIEAAAHALTRLRSQLIEPHLTLDAQVGVLLTGPGVLHVAITAGVRLYRARGGLPERLHSKAARPEGIASGAPFTTDETVENGDLWMLGTRDTFSVRSVGNLAALLARSSRAPVHELCEAIVGPARDTVNGAATVVLRAV